MRFSRKNLRFSAISSVSWHRDRYRSTDLHPTDRDLCLRSQGPQPTGANGGRAPCDRNHSMLSNVTRHRDRNRSKEGARRHVRPFTRSENPCNICTVQIRCKFPRVDARLKGRARDNWDAICRNVKIKSVQTVQFSWCIDIGLLGKGN